MKYKLWYMVRLFATTQLLIGSTIGLFAQDTLNRKKTDSLREVIIQGKKPLLEIGKGKIVLNLQNSALTSGVSAFDALRKLPGITIGQDDNILLRGTSGINVMIDGKMSYLSGKQLVALLQGMSAENLSKIELITAPTAEFDAAGNAGIINLVTKKNNTLGYAVDFRSGISKGRFWMVNENITGSINTAKLNVFASLDYNTPHRVIIGQSGNTIDEQGKLLLLNRTVESVYKINYYTYRFGGEWQLSRRESLSLHYNGYFDDFRADKFSSLQLTHADGTPQAQIYSQNTTKEPYHYHALNMGYRFDIDSTGSKWTADAHYISYRNLSDAWINSVTSDPAGNGTKMTDEVRLHQPGFIKIKSIKTDIQFPLSAFLLKAGLKYTSIANDNASRFDSLLTSGFVEAESLSNHFQYEENVFAIYTSVSRKIKKTSLEGGLRLEDTYARGLTLKQDFDKTWKYTQLFPTFSLDHNFNETHKVSLSVSRRITRPSYADLNPVRWYNDQYFYYTGNPGLQPEMAWLFSSAYTFKSKYIVTLTYGLRDNYMGRLLLVDSSTGSIKSQTANFRQAKRLDVDVSVPFTFYSFWDVQLSAGLNYTRYPISEKNSLKQLMLWSGSLQLQQNWKLPGGAMLQLSCFYYAPELIGIYQTYYSFYVDAGIKKSFFNNKLGMQITGGDLFRSNRYQAISQSDVTDYHYIDRRDSRRVALTLRYHIGGKLTNKRATVIEEQGRF